MNQTKMDSDGNLILIDAVKRNDETEVKRLIDAGADVNETDDQGKTALFYAVQQTNNKTVVRVLILAGADVDETDDQDKTALFYAVENDNDSIVLLLIDAGADVEARDDQDKTALFYAAANTSVRDASILAALVEKGNAVVNASDNCGRTPLFYAITTSVVSTRYLLDHDANLKADCNMSILTFVIEEYLMKQESPSNPAPLSEVFDLLIEKGLQTQSIVQSIINLVFCKIPHLFAANERETIEGFPVITQDQVLKALEEARQYLDEGNEEKAQSILEIENKIKQGEIFEALEMLFKLGADPNSADSAGNTALHYATLLPMMDVSQETVMKICDCLMRRGLRFNTKNHQSQTPLLFCLSENHWKFLSTSKRPRLESLVEVCKFLLKKESALSEISQSGETVFHLLMKLSQQVLNLHDKAVRQEALCQVINLLNHFSSFKAAKRAIKISDDSGNFPLHLWAALTLSTPEDYTGGWHEDYTFEKILRTLLECFLKCGANVNARNDDQKTPLHLCKTWAAVKLLIKTKANANDLDSSGRSPLLVAANSKAFLKYPGLFYPDVTEDAETFWKNAIKMELHPWTTDKHGKSVLSILIESDASVLAETLVKAACEDVNNDSILVCLLNTICKDETKHQWKENLVEGILKTRKRQTGSEEALCICCRIIMKESVSTNDRKGINEKLSEQQTRSRDGKNTISENEAHLSKIKHETWKENDTKSSVHYRIAKRLLASGSDFKIPDSLGQSCLAMAETCPVLNDLLAIKWDPVSKKYKEVLTKVSMRQESEQVEMFLYHKDPIATGRFGVIFAGINEKDGREVAIKRIKHQGTDENEKEEMKTLVHLTECEQVVRYLLFYENNNFLHVILELMEGNLDEYLEEKLDATKSVQLCKDIVMGLNYLHKSNIIHRDLKPQNILYKIRPKLCLKIADFGHSRTDNIHSGCKDIAGTRCWLAPEVFRGGIHSKSSDTFSCGLILHYMLSGQKHPFSPADCEGKSKSEVAIETEDNIMDDQRDGWNDSLSSEASHLVKSMLESKKNNRVYAFEALNHPFFWKRQKQIDLLMAVSNQPEFELARAKRGSMGPLTALETDLENSFGIIVKYGAWNDPRYLHMPDIYAEMTRRRSYDTRSVVALLRFIRNAYAHISENTRPSHIRKLLLEDFVFLEYFPALVMEVYKAVTTHGWNQTRQGIGKLISEDDGKDFLMKPIANNEDRLVIPWNSISKRYRDMLENVAKQSKCAFSLKSYGYWYHEDPIARGQFGNIYVGVNVNDGREVAIKKIEKVRMHRPQDKREIRNLIALADCGQVVRCLSFFEDQHFSYVVLELMEGNLEEYLNVSTFDAIKATLLYKDVVIGLKSLHEQDILHRDLKPQNILYKTHPKLCLKIADFGLSRRIDGSSSTSVYGSNAGTRCWIAPEIFKFPNDHSKSSDMFSCGLLLHYTLSGKKHPFCPADCANKSEIQVAHETEDNLMKGKMEGWDDSLSPEASDLVRKMIESMVESRPTAEEAIDHPLFWTKKKKMDLLIAVGNQPEFECPRPKRSWPLTAVETDLENSFLTVVNYGSWIHHEYYLHMAAIYAEMRSRRSYDTRSVVELVRFIRNAYAHISENTRPSHNRKLLLEDFVFLEYFPALVMEVYKAVTTHGWDQTREEIKYAMRKK